MRLTHCDSEEYQVMRSVDELSEVALQRQSFHVRRAGAINSLAREGTGLDWNRLALSMYCTYLHTYLRYVHVPNLWKARLSPDSKTRYIHGRGVQYIGNACTRTSNL